MSLAADFTIRTSGRVQRQPAVVSVRPLTSEEVVERQTREAGIKVPPLQRISSRHRQLARLIASGMSTTVAAHAVGLKPSRVSMLKGDPSFQNLVAHCTAELDAATIGFAEKMAGVGTDSLEELQRRLEDDPDSFEVDELIRLTQMLADRTGHAPKRVEEKNINLSFGDKLAAHRETARKAITSYVTEVIEDADVIEEVA